ncbi:MAG: PAS domain S-box protein [Clostridiales bacterium]|nr:PAS domain S-box protein [Clostridiales bacterium]
MKPGVAIIAALVVLVALLMLPVNSATEIAASENENLLAEINRTCKVVGDATVDADEARRQQVLSDLVLSEEMECGLFQSDGAPLYCSSETLTIPQSYTALESFRDGHVHMLERDVDGRTIAYAVYRYPDDQILVVTIAKVTALKIIRQDVGLIVQMVVIVLATAVFLWIWYSIYQRDNMLANVMLTMDRFADGDYDARITPVPGRDRETATYNEVLARLQNRIFRQRNRNEAVNTVMNQMQNGIVAVDQNLRVIVITPVAKKLLGVQGNAEGQFVNKISNDVKLDTVLTEAMQQSGVYTNEVAARTAVGRGHRPLRLYVSPMRNDGKVVGALAMIEDITELKRLEQVRTDFAANVSHELKTPLTSIRGFVETLEAGAIDNPEMAHKFLRIIMMETERLTRLINDILSISKLESGNDEVAIERIRLDKMADDVCEMLTIHAGEKEVTLHSGLNSVPVYIMGNPDRVEQMLINLVENAIKYNKPGGSVTVQVFESGGEANVTISDTGIGIAEEHLPRMFERFYRVDKGRARGMGGTGLGLAIVKHIVRSMNGEIEVHSKLGEGTEFLITLPVAPPANPEADTIFDNIEQQ